MTKKNTLERLTLADVKARVAKGESQTRADAPEAESLPSAFWADGVRVTRRVDK